MLNTENILFILVYRTHKVTHTQSKIASRLFIMCDKTDLKIPCAAA